VLLNIELERARKLPADGIEARPGQRNGRRFNPCKLTRKTS
jgi:hypothetical protein